jgi:hypothetical protein
VLSATLIEARKITDKRHGYRGRVSLIGLGNCDLLDEADHFPFAFSAVIRARNFQISLKRSWRTGPGGSLRAVFSSSAAIASCSCISVSVRPVDLIGIIFPAPSAVRFGEICLCGGEQSVSESIEPL